MKLEFEPVNIERSDDFEEQTFGISDATVIIEILRSKLYSNPIKVLVQEYMSNARDAHRELGKENVPIEVTCPTGISPQFEVRDFGPGITPKRIKDVFINYGSSTKRDSNTQTGGFGIGSKSGWSYSDTFNVISITNETGRNIKRSYSCIIDESRMGKLIKMCDDEYTEEPCGTRIIVPVRKENYQQFRKYALQSGYFWKTRPIIHGEKFEDIKTINKGENWGYFETNTVPEDFQYNKSFVIYDGIPYPLKSEALNEHINSTVIGVLTNVCFGLEFQIGDITISANREELQYTEKTKKILANRVNEMVDEFSEKFKEIIKQEKTFLDALVRYNQLCDENEIVGKLVSEKIDWNGVVLKKMISIDHDSKCVNIQRFYCEPGEGCLTQRKNGQIRLQAVLEKNVDPTNGIYRLKNVYLNDDPLRGAPLAKITNLFHLCQDKNHFEVFVISYRTNNIRGLTPGDIKTATDSLSLWKERHYIDNLEFAKTSTLAKYVGTRTSKATGPVLGRNFKYKDIVLSPGTNGGEDYVTIQETQEYENNLSGYYAMYSEGKINIGNRRYALRDRYDMRKFTRLYKHILEHLSTDKILLFTPKAIEALKGNPNLILIKNDIQDEIVKNIDVNILKEYLDYENKNRDQNHSIISYFSSKPKDAFVHPNGFVKRLTLTKEYDTYKATDNYKLAKELFEVFADGIHNVHKLKSNGYGSTRIEESFSDMYPLLSNFYSHNINEGKCVKHIIDYINFVDANQ